MSGKLKIGVFGGYRGMTMITVLMGHPDAELVAVCDKVQWILDNVKNEAEKHGQTVACYNNFEDFFKHDMDAVVLANYANEHAPYAIRLLRSGRHVLSEVLPCETMAQAVELIEAVEESGCVYAYAENYCYMAHTFEMWRRYQNGDIGEVMYAEGEYVHDCSSIWPGITYGERNHWRNRMHPAFYCTHSIGPMLTITGRRPVQVVGFETMPHPDMIALGGIGGMAYIIPSVSSWNFEVGVSGAGFLALAVMIFGQWKPFRIFLAAVFFALFKSLANIASSIPFLADLGWTQNMYNMIPFIASMIILAFTSKKSRAPKAEGIPYDKGSR